MADYTQQFTTLMNSTPIAYYSGAREFINDVISRNPLAGIFLRGKSLKDVVTGGPKVQDRIYLEKNSRWQSYEPGEPWSISNPQSHTSYSRPWAFAGSHMTWTEQELMMNQAEHMSASGKMAYYKSVLVQKQQDVLTDIVEGMDDHLFAAPDAQVMESDAVAGNLKRRIYSIFSLINEETNGLYKNSTDANAQFSTLYGLDPSAYTDAEGSSNWKPKVIGYDPADLDDPRNGLLARMEEMTWELDYRVASGTPTPFGNQSLLGPTTVWSQYAILCGIAGLKYYREARWLAGDQMVRRTDPAIRTASGYDFFGIPLDHSPRIDRAAVYNPNANGAAGSAGVTYENAGNAGPRFYFIDTDKLKLYFHTQKMLQKRPAREPDGSVEYWWQPVVCWWQLFPRSLRRQGILVPSDNASGGAA